MVRLVRKESKVTYNQAGYSGQSMSVRARNAYNSGEMPKSKWTKTEILNSLSDMFGEIPASGFKQFSKDTLFTGVCRYLSWHHTGKYANETSFYSVSYEDALEFAHEHNIESMKGILEKEYDTVTNSRTSFVSDDNKDDLEDRIKNIHEIYSTLLRHISDNLSDIKEYLYKGQNALFFDILLPSHYIIRFHSYPKNIKDLEHLYECLKRKTKNKDTEDIYKFLCFVESNLDTKGNKEVLSDLNIMQALSMLL